MPGVWSVGSGSTSAPFTVPTELGDLAEQVRGLQAAADAASSAGERAGWLVGLRELIDTCEVAFTSVLSRFDACGDAPVMSAQRDATAWLCHELRLAAGDARGRVQVARDADLLAAPLAAAAGGELRFDHVRAISTATRPLAHDRGQQQTGVDLLHSLAQQADPAAVRRAGRHLAEVVDPDGATRTREEQYARRWLRISPLLDGMTALDGVLDAEAAATLSAAMAPLMVPAGADDRRSASQRRADALVDLATLALKTEDLPVLSGTATTLDVLVPAALTAGSAGAAVAAPAGGCSVQLHVAGGIVHDAPGGPVDLCPDTVARLLCDASIGRILVDANGVPLQLGRRVRLFTPDQRRALTARDAGCRFPGCTRPPRYTDAHHVVPWQHGGPTDLTNALLVCRFHHRLLDHDAGRGSPGGWRVEVLDAALGSNGPLVFHGPAGQRVPSHPRAGP